MNRSDAEPEPTAWVKVPADWTRVSNGKTYLTDGDRSIGPALDAINASRTYLDKPPPEDLPDRIIEPIRRRLGVLADALPELPALLAGVAAGEVQREFDAMVQARRSDHVTIMALQQAVRREEKRAAKAEAALAGAEETAADQAQNAQHWRECAEQAGREANERGAALEWVRLALTKFDATTRWDTDDVIELVGSVQAALDRRAAALGRPAGPGSEARCPEPTAHHRHTWSGYVCPGVPLSQPAEEGE